MAEARDLLVEIGTEELPPKALKQLSEAFAEAFHLALTKAELPHGEIVSYASPRRLALLIPALAVAQPDRVLERRGPALRAAFDEAGRPTNAALGFARSCGVAVEQLETLEQGDAAWLVHRSREPRRATGGLIPPLVEQALAALPIPKRMRWADLKVEFVRPVHWAVLLFGDEVLDAEILGVRTGRETRGHRFHRPAPLFLAEPRGYAPLLETEGRVMPGFAARRVAVREQVIEAGHRFGGTPALDDALLDEVTALVEWPVALVAGFEPRFLEVPSEVLVSAMTKHQKCFPLLGADGKLLPHFVAVSNIESRDPAQVIAGNARVMRARLADADFFFRTDLQHPLDRHLDRLQGVVFQEKLGSLYEKSQRVAQLARRIAGEVGADAALAERAGLLCKCDLMTEIVGEFPELQGRMGQHYAHHHGEPDAVAVALDEQYMPRFAGDRLPATAVGQALAIADRLDTLVGIFGIGQAPTGDRDPFALRRAALGLLRIVIEGRFNLDLEAALGWAATSYADKLTAPGTVNQVYEFAMERLRAWYIDQGVRPDTFEAVLARRPTRPYDFHRRIQAVTAFRELAEAESLAAANKRVQNILRKAAEPIPASVDVALLIESAERALFGGLATQQDAVQPMLESGDYSGALRQLAGLREAVDEFFEQVLVMADDLRVRGNRLALLSSLREQFLRVADISRLQA